VAWPTVCRPKSQGGLGVLNIFAQNKALLLKNLHKFYNKANIPWVNLIWESYYEDSKLPGQRLEGSFWWKSTIGLHDEFKAIARCNIGDGKSVYFWQDLWCNGCLDASFPCLFSFVKDKWMTVEKVLQAEYLEDHFNLPLSTEAFTEFESLENICDDLRRSEF
jgi:hypothetical protein